MHANFYDEMISRVKDNTPHYGEVLAVISKIRTVMNEVDAARNSFTADNNLSDQGRKAKLREFLTEHALKDFARATHPVRRAVSYARAQREGLANEVVRTEDPLAEMRAQEIRAFLRAAEPPQREALAQDLCRTDEGAKVVLGAPAFLSGLDDGAMRRPNYGAHRRLRDAYAETKHGDRLAYLKSTEEDYEVAGAAAAVIRAELQRVSGLSGQEFEAVLTPLEQATDA